MYSCYLLGTATSYNHCAPLPPPELLTVIIEIEQAYVLQDEPSIEDAGSS